MIPFTYFGFQWNNGAAWIDISADVQADPAPKGSRGILSTDINERVGSVGKLTFVLDNSASNSAGLEGYYTPGHPNCISPNWGKPYSYPIRIIAAYDGRVKYLWYGTFEPGPGGIQVTPLRYGERKVTATFRDWMGLAQERKLNLLTLATYQRIEQAVTLLLAALSAGEQPQARLFNQGDSGFLAVFDDANSGTTVYSELDKLAKSELGYIYVRADRTSGEQLTVENRNLRWQAGGLTSSGGAASIGDTLLLSDGTDFLLEDGTLLDLNTIHNAVSRVSKDAADCGILLLEDGTNFLLEDGTTLTLDETQDAVFDEGDLLVDRPISVRHFDNGYQCARVSLQQKQYGTSTVTLWEMETPLYIGAGKTLTGIRGRYRDPNGAASYVNGYNFTTPVSGTDWVANSKSDGSGTNTTANITVTASTGSAEVEFSITNSGAACYVTTLQIRGKGVFNYDSLDIVLGEDIGKKRLDLNLHYETDGTIGQEYARDITRIPNGTTTIQAMPLWANRDSFNINAFMDLDIGSLYDVSETMTHPEGEQPYFINGYEFEVITVLNNNVANLNVIWSPNGLPYSRVFSI